MIPIYYVICEQIEIVPTMVPGYRLIKSIACEFDDTRELYDKEVAPLQVLNPRIIAFIFTREPDNVIKGQATTTSSVPPQNT